jgi:hypothetical protein
LRQPDRIALYRCQVLSALPRIFSALDRDPFSATYGSFDREYWAWATKDFSNVDLQRAIYPLALVYSYDFPNNKFHRKPRVRDWIGAALAFWRSTRRRNGSHDHHFPWEHSFVGEAFPLYEICEAFTLLDRNRDFSQAERAAWIDEIGRSAEFLCRSDETHGFISNHRLGAACGLLSAARIVGEVRFERRSRELVDSVVAKRSVAEGWLHEYGGADPGYQTLGTYYLANYFRLTQDEGFLKEVVWPSLNFLIHFVHPDGSIGGEYGSRNCPLFYPSGFEVLAATVPEAAAIAAAAAPAIESGATPNLLAMDTRNFVPMLSSYCQAASLPISETEAQTDMPYSRSFERYWPEAGLFVRSDPSFYVVVGCSKGGVMKVFRKSTSRLVASHAGYVVETKNGAFSNQFLGAGKVEPLLGCAGRETELSPRRTLVVTSRFFGLQRDRRMTPTKFLLFRTFGFTLGRSKPVMDWFKRTIITGRFIHRRKPAPGVLTREIAFSPGAIVITDRLAGAPAGASVRAGDFFTTIYMASSKYFRNHEALTDRYRKAVEFDARGECCWTVGSDRSEELGEQ